MNKKILLSLMLICLVSFTSAIDYTATISQGSNGGSNWGASYDVAVLSDNNTETYYGIQGSNDFELLFEFEEANITSIEIIWQNQTTLPTPKLPLDYYFSYGFDVQTGYGVVTNWITPLPWTRTTDTFHTLYNLSLTGQIKTDKIKLFRNGTGSKSGIAISEIRINEIVVIPEVNETNQTNTTNVTIPEVVTPKKKSSGGVSIKCGDYTACVNGVKTSTCSNGAVKTKPCETELEKVVEVTQTQDEPVVAEEVETTETPEQWEYLPEQEKSLKESVWFWIILTVVIIGAIVLGIKLKNKD